MATEEEADGLRAEVDREAILGYLDQTFPLFRPVEFTADLAATIRSYEARKAFEDCLYLGRKSNKAWSLCMLRPSFWGGEPMSRVNRLMSGYYRTRKLVSFALSSSEFTRAGGWFLWLMKDAVLWCQRPDVSLDENGQFHSTTGPAVRSVLADLYCLRGVRVQEHVFRNPTVERVAKVKNLEERAAFIDCMIGWPRFLSETKSEPIDENDNAVEGTLEALYEAPDGKRLVVTCTTGRVFALGVPVWMMSCGEAQTWLRGGVRMNVIART